MYCCIHEPLHLHSFADEEAEEAPEQSNASDEQEGIYFHIQANLQMGTVSMC